MTRAITLLRRLRAVFFKGVLDGDLDEEIRTHLEMQREENERRGMSPEEARRAALRSFGGVEQVKEKYRRRRGLPVVETTLQDLRYAARMLLKHKGTTAVAVLSLTLGIGANTALFSVVDAMLLKMLPVEEPENLVLFKSLAPPRFNPGSYNGTSDTDLATGQQVMSSFPHQSFRSMRERPGALTDVMSFGYISGGLNVSADGRADVAGAQAVSGNYYEVLGVRPLLGRALTDGDDRAGADPVAVISHRYWQQRFGGAGSAVGKQINLNGVAFTLVGVTPQGFEGTMDVGSILDVTIPIAWEPQVVKARSRMTGAGVWWLRLIGRLKPGATREQARASLENAFRQSVAEHRVARQAQAQASGGSAIGDLEPGDYPRLALDPGGQGEMSTRRSYAPSLYLLLGVVGLVLLVACANVANLLLSRAAARQKEFAVRAALGAGRLRLIRQLLTESLLLSAAGGALGVLFALWLKNGLLAVGEWGGGGLRGLEPKLDWRVFAFTAGLSLSTGILFGSAPAWRSTRVDLTPALKEGGRGSSVASRSWLGRGLVVSQVALSLLLLIGAGLFVRTLVNLRSVEPGFNTRNLLLFNAQPALLGYKEERLEGVYRQIAERLETVPGVRAVTFSSSPLLARHRSTRSVYLRGALTAAPDAEGRVKPSGPGHIHQVRENFLEAMEIPLLAGRGLRPQDDARSPRVAVVNQTFADEYFPGEYPVGKRFAFDHKKPDEVEIVGVAGDAKYSSQRAEIPPTMYVSWRQELPGMVWGVTYEVRTAGDPKGFVAAVREAVRGVDGGLPLDNVKTQIEQADETLARERLFAKLLTLFGLLAQLLAAIGLFGVMAYAVAQRTREIGIRMALGASRRRVLRMVLRQGMSLTLTGIATGLAGAYLLLRYLGSRTDLSEMLYGVEVADPFVYVVMAILLTLVTLAACYVPARRATRVNPLVALRNE